MAVHLPNCPQFIIAYYAVLMAGGIVVPCNPQYVARELTYQLNNSGAEVIITLSLTYPIVKQIRAETPLKHVIAANVKEYFPGLLKFLFTVAVEKKEGHRQDISGDANIHWFQHVLAGAPARPTPVAVDMEDTAVLMYTGGTTGISKGAQLTHRNLQANAVQTKAWFPRMAEGQEIILTSLPLFHSYGMTTCMNLGILAAATLLLIFNPRTQGLHQRRGAAAGRGAAKVPGTDRRATGGRVWVERGHAGDPRQSDLRGKSHRHHRSALS